MAESEFRVQVGSAAADRCGRKEQERESEKKQPEKIGKDIKLCHFEL